MGNGPWLYGKAVVRGEVKFLSVSRLSGADEREGGCLRKWYYEMVLGRKSPGTRSTKRGDDLHAEVEKYLKTGDRSLSTLALGGMHMVPDPVKIDPETGLPDMLVEHDLLLRPRDRKPEDLFDVNKPDQRKQAEAYASQLLANAPLRAAGIPVLGRMDLIHGRGTNKGGVNIDETLDPPGTVEVLDWKSTGSPQWIKNKNDLPKLIQMAGYGEWVFRVEPAATSVRLSHGYFVERGGPSRKVTLRVIRDDLQKTWEHAEGVARRIRDAARETEVDKIDANVNACDNYGGCFHREICKARMHQALSSFFGAQGAAQLLGKAPAQENVSMGLLDKLKSGNTAAAPATTTPATTAPASNPLANLVSKAPTAPAAVPATTPVATGPSPEQIAAERAKLEAEEAAERAAAQLRLAVDSLKPLLVKIEGYQAANPVIGSPAYAGSMARVAATIKGLAGADSATGITGSGQLAEVTISTQAEAESIVQQLDELAGAQQINPIGTAPTPSVNNTPAPAPSIMSPETPAPTEPKPKADAGANATGDTNTANNAATPKTEAPKTRAPRAKKSADDAAGEADKTPATAFILIVDAKYDGPARIQSFHPILDELCAEICKMSNDLDIRAAGVRVDKDGNLVFDKDSSPLTFGRGDGALAALIHERTFTPGVWFLSTRGNRLAEVAAAALGEHARKSGGYVVWGDR